ncbi:MAG TPA: aminodeoxychorismate synthase component I [Proteobacteria bacterium]|nr:aminodeoxychorismate synthase component I [Pseudomonadota bacterium]
MHKLKQVIGKIVNIESQPVDFIRGDEKIEDIYAPLSSDVNAFLLLSGGRGDCSRYSFLACDPFLVVRAWGNKIEINNRHTTIEVVGNPFDMLQEILDGLKMPSVDIQLPFYAGAVGYFGYDLRYHLEKLPDVAENDLSLPDLYLIFPGIILVHDRIEQNYRIVTIGHRLHGEESEKGHQKIQKFQSKIRRAGPTPARLDASKTKQTSARGGQRPREMISPNPPTPPFGKGGQGGILKGGWGNFQVKDLTSNFTHDAYVSAIKRVREYIRQGDIYQVNLSQRFTFEFGGSPYSLFRALFAANPAPFYAYLNCGDFCVLSTSPERFIRREGSYIETRPIKGTRPRGKDPAEDERMKKELLESPKEDAELSMIVDLLRNDLGKACLPGTVQVKEHKRIEAYQNVFHLVSTVTGMLRRDCTQTDVLMAVFPGGSITGCPKIRAMEIIEELEPVKRGIYTGSIGYVSLHDTMNLSIAIRTAVYKDRCIYLSVGGGIVYNSDPETEYQETLHKGETFFKLLHQAAR